MPLKQVAVEGYDALKAAIAAAGGQRVLVLLTGSKVGGKSWCPDCVVAEPVIERVLESSRQSADCTFITCSVPRDLWKDKSNVFRTDAQMMFTCVPTLIEWGSKVKRLSEGQLTNAALIKELVMEDD